MRADGLGDAEISARLILQHHLDKTPASLQLSLSDPVGADIIQRFLTDIQKRSNNYPLQYVIGKVEFYNISLKVDPRVLIPRPETEILVERAIAILQKMTTPRILDIGTGSGNIAVAIAANISQGELVAVDISGDALALARENASLNDVTDKIRFVCDDCLKASSWEDIGAFDMIVANPPYVGESEFATLQPEIRLHEPKIALVSDGDDLKFYRVISNNLDRALKDAGFVLFEVGAGQAESVVQVMKDIVPDIRAEIINDLSGIPRVVVGKSIH